MRVKPPSTGTLIDSTGRHCFINNNEVTFQEYQSYIWWMSPEKIWYELMKERCYNCLYLAKNCECCVGCGQIDSDIIGNHGYGCVIMDMDV